MKIFHTADIHYSPKHLKLVDRAMSFAVDTAIERKCDLAILAGDSFDSTMGIHEPAVAALAQQVSRLMQHMPVFMLYGTTSHDRPGSLDFIRELGGEHQIVVVDKPEELGVFRDAHGTYTFDPNAADDAVLDICAVPSLNKADPEIMAFGAHEWVLRTLRDMGTGNALRRERGVPSILVTHGTVTGSTTESGYAMVAPDHEFSTDTLALADADIVMLGHIHKHQHWTVHTPSGHKTRIAYPGSLANLVFGRSDPAGFLIWEINNGLSNVEFIEAPSCNRIEISFNGPPVLEEVEKYAATLGPDDHIRIRYDVDQEHAAGVDRDRIEQLLSSAGNVKIEGTVHAIQTVRAAGINRAVTLGDKLAAWAEQGGDEDKIEELQDRLQMLQSMDPQEIVRAVTRNQS